MPTHRAHRDTALTPDRAFVVQLRQADPEHPERLCGRVEHISSGTAAGFASLSELHQFMSRLPAPPNPGKQP